MNLIEKVKQVLSDANQSGVPVPTVRDPQTGKGSFTATMLVISFGASVLLLLGKITHYVGDVEYANVLWLLGISLSAYLGRKFQTKVKDISIE